MIAAARRLSAGQEALCLHQQLNPSSIAYNIVSTVRLAMPVKAALLRARWQAMVGQHALLRSTFSADGMGFAPVPPELSVIPAGHLAPSDIRQALEANVRRPFDLAGEPPLRGYLYQRGPGEDILQIIMHHIAGDLWSLQLMTEALMREKSPAPTVGFEALLAYTATQADSERSWWQAHLAHPGPASRLPWDRPRTSDETAASYNFAVPMGAELRTLARRQQVTLFTLLLTAFQVTLQRAGAGERVWVCSPVANRPETRFETVVGPFANPMVFEAEVRGPFEAILRRGQQTVDGILAHPSHPFAHLQRDSGSAGQIGRFPLTDTMFMLQRPHRTPVSVPHVPSGDPCGLETGTFVAGGDLLLELLHLDIQALPCDLRLELIEGEGAFYGAFHYRTALFDTSTVADLAALYQSVLQAVLDDSMVDVDDLPRLPRPATVIDRFEAQVAAGPERPALLSDDRVVTYGELNERANGVAAALTLEPWQRVGILLPRSIASVVAMLGILKAGGVYVPLSPDGRGRTRQMAEEAGLTCVVTAPEHAWDEQALLVDECPPQTGVPARAHCPALYLLFTSGSTGRPRPVLGTQAGALNRIDWMRRVYPFEPGEVGCHKTPLVFVDHVWELFGPLLEGLPVLVVPDGGLTGECLRRHRVSRLVGVPALIERLLPEPLPAMRLWIGSGEAMSVDLVQRFKARQNGLLLNIYGMTEAAGDVTCFDTSQLSTPFVPLGEPLDGFQIRLVDGEILVAGIGLAFGVGEDGWYRTGDFAVSHPDGTLEYRGRQDQQIQYHGVRIELREIEAAVLAHPGVRQASASCDGELVVHWAGEAPDLAAFVALHLPPALLPRLIHRGALARTETGKVDRQRMSREAVLQGMMADVLGLASVQASDNFFALGGTSLQILTLHSRIEAHFGRMPLATILQSPSVRSIESAMAQGQTAGVLVPIQPGGTRIPLYLAPPAGGGVLSYYGLSRRLGLDQPVFGFEPPEGSRPQSIEELAARYVSELRQVQPRGPYRLGGYSVGGKIAFEMARQLGEVDLVVLLDSRGFVPVGAQADWSRRMAYELGVLQHVPGRERWSHVRSRLAKFGRPVVPPDKDLYHHMLGLDAAYPGGDYAGRVVLLKAALHPPPWVSDLGWGQWVKGPFSLIEVPGYHGKMLLEEPTVALLAGHLARCLTG